MCISSNPAAQYLIARGARMAQALDGDLFVFYVDTGADESDENQRTLADNIRFAESVGAKVVKSRGQSGGGKSCGVRARESHYASGFRAVGHEGMEEIFLSFRNS